MATDPVKLAALIQTQVEYEEAHPNLLMAEWDKPCSGCAHSASGAPYPGHPSGESPCMNCLRNPRREEGLAGYEKYTGHPWPETKPEDNYKSLDVLMRFIRSQREDSRDGD